MQDMLKHGIAAYKQTMNLKPQKPDPDPLKDKNTGKKEGLLKTTVPHPVELQPSFNKADKSELPGKPDLPESMRGTSSGGIEAARKILHAAYGEEKGDALLNKSLPVSKENVFDFLEDFNCEQIVFLLKDESPATSALVLSRLKAKVSAEVLKKFPSALKLEIMKRIARQDKISPEVLNSVAGGIKEKARNFSSTLPGKNDIKIDGMQTLAAILKHGEFSFGDRIIDEMESVNPDISKGLKDKLYSLDDIVDVLDRPLAEKLASMTDKNIAFLLKGRNPEFREKILSNISAGRRTMIYEESDILGAVSKHECDEVASDFLVWFRQAREQDGLILTTDKDWVQ